MSTCSKASFECYYGPEQKNFLGNFKLWYKFKGTILFPHEAAANTGALAVQVTKKELKKKKNLKSC